MTLSINSTRGEAMHAVIQYSVWVHRHTSPEAPEGGESQSGFDGISRVREVLEEHLDLTREPSLAIRSVYGRWFPQLLLLDREWATARIDRIFPSDEALQDYWAAAWGTYVVVCRPYDETFEVLQSIYAQAIERIGRTRPRWRELADSEEKLSEHLMVWYWQGRLSLERADVMLRRFYEKAPPRVRAHALTFIGMNLRDTTGTIPSEILERLKRLWAWRLREVQAGENAATLAKELSAFGWWFVSGRFDDVWALTELISALRVARTINPDHLVLERLAAVARALPGGAIEALRLLIEGDTEGWKILAWRDEVRAILTVAISGDDASASEAAVALIHQIGARGYRELRDLIPRRH